MVRLSASKIKSFLTCSYQAWLSYYAGHPRTGNEGSQRGDITHRILECLAHPKRKEIVNKILFAQNAFYYPPIERMVRLAAKHHELDGEDHVEMINSFLLNALNDDFHKVGSVERFIEREFEIKNDDYWIYGFIDQLVVYPDRIKIIDFKSSKKKWAPSSDDVLWNVQALMYALVASKWYPNIPCEVEFLFVKFNKRNKITLSFTQEQLNGFEAYLKYFSDYLSDFGIEKAHGNFAKHSIKTKFFCGADSVTLKKDDGTPKWVCPSKFPFIYFSLVDENGRQIKSSRKKEDFSLDIERNPRYSVIEKEYSGCPVWAHLWK